jgi:serine/threonine protein kinase/Tfp pilus assembly protein PilF
LASLPLRTRRDTISRTMGQAWASNSLATTGVVRLCRKCSAKILADAPEGLCTACLFESGLGILADAPVGQIRHDDPGRVSEPPRADPSASLGSKEAIAQADKREVLGDYELLEELGRGGQAVVYRARQKSLNRIVALKVIRSGQWTTPSHLKRFQLEAEAAASLDNPNIVPIYEVGEHNGCCYFSMKLVGGGQLDEISKHEPMPTRRAAELIARLARAVHYAHERGILHRDIKPGNILIDVKGEPHLTDFGLARLVEGEGTVTRTLDTLGTPSYMAPEQALGNPAGAGLTSATDVYGLGAVLYHLLTGHPPFAGGTTYDTIRLLLETEPRQPRLWNPRTDRDLATVCLKCLEKNPQRRYASAFALAEDLEHWLKHEPIRARHTGLFGRGKKWLRRKPTMALLILSLAALATAIGWNLWKSEFVPSPAAAGIAVLPFENLSSDREDEFFADGVQDDVLTKLAKIRDLKVISRTSVMQYRGKRNMRDIGATLGVSHALQGSVRKSGTQLHLNAQLIDTRTDAHVWAEQYDCDLNGVFAAQSAIALRVADQLHAQMSTTERLDMARPPTANLTAFKFYTQAKNLVLTTSFTTNAKANLLKAADLLNEAIANDSSFFQAYCLLSHTHDLLYFFGFDRTPARLALAESAIQAAFRLRPDSGEAHLARAENLYRGHLDYDGALAELEVARQTLPNDPMLFELKGYIERRRGKQQQALQSLERAVDLDPRNFFTLQQIAASYDLLQRYADEATMLERALTIKPGDVDTKIARALMELDWKGDTRPLHQLIDEIRAKNPADVENVADAWLTCALAERDATAARTALSASGENPLSDDVIQFNRPFVEGVIARMTNDSDKARAAFTAARAAQEKMVQAQPNYGPPLCVLGLIDAALGRTEEALREGRRAVELLPVKKDAINGPRMIAHLAMIAAWAGEKDFACQQLALAIHPPAPVTYGQLKLLPFWDPLRGDPRFEKIVVSLAPK